MRISKLAVGMVTLAIMILAGGGAVYAGGSSAGGNAEKKTLVISGIDHAMFVAGMDTARGIRIGIYQVGTTVEQAKRQENIVAGASSQPLPSSMSIRDSKDTYSDKPGFNANDTSYTGIAWLYAAPFKAPFREWTGAGEYDVFLAVGDTDYYLVEKVIFTSKETLLEFKDFSRLP